MEQQPREMRANVMASGIEQFSSSARVSIRWYFSLSSLTRGAAEQKIENFIIVYRAFFC
jgi:hypothetical protein